MNSSALAFAFLTLVGTLAALDLVSTHQPATPEPVTARQSVMRVDQPQNADDDIEARLVKKFVDNGALTITAGRAAHRCVTAEGWNHEGPVQYCFGTPAPQIIHN